MLCIILGIHALVNITKFKRYKKLISQDHFCDAESLYILGLMWDNEQPSYNLDLLSLCDTIQTSHPFHINKGIYSEVFNNALCVEPGEGSPQISKIEKNYVK